MRAVAIDRFSPVQKMTRPKLDVRISLKGSDPERHTFTDRQLDFIDEQYRRLEDRLERARASGHDTGYDMLGKLIDDAKKLRKVLIKAKR